MLSPGSLSMRRWARPIQPPPGPSSPRVKRIMPIQTALRTAGSVSPALQVRVMCALEQAEVLVVATEHECRRREQLEVAGLERRRIVGTRQRARTRPSRRGARTRRGRARGALAATVTT